MSPSRPRWLRAVGVHAFTAASLGAGLWLGGGFARAAGSAPASALGSDPLPLPPSMAERPRPLGDSLSVNAQPMELSITFASDPPARVIAWYEAELRKQNLLPLARAGADAGHVSVFDPVAGVQRFATALAQPDGSTLILSGTADPRRAPRILSGARDAPFPVPEEHQAYLVYASNDAGGRATSAQFVTKLSAGEVLDFYRDRLGREGFRVGPTEAPDAPVFVRQGVTVSVAVQALGKRGAAVFVIRSEGGTR